MESTSNGFCEKLGCNPDFFSPGLNLSTAMMTLPTVDKVRLDTMRLPAPPGTNIRIGTGDP